jgi:hypothetical protein
MGPGRYERRQRVGWGEAAHCRGLALVPPPAYNRRGPLPCTACSSLACRRSLQLHVRGKKIATDMSCLRRLHQHNLVLLLLLLLLLVVVLGWGGEQLKMQ